MLKRVSVDEDLSYVVRLSDFLLDFIGHNVFTLRELENVLLAVDDF
jgi:hypothetical protein